MNEDEAMTEAEIERIQPLGNALQALVQAEDIIAAALDDHRR